MPNSSNHKFVPAAAPDRHDATHLQQISEVSLTGCDLHNVSHSRQFVKPYNATVAILCRYSGPPHSSGIPALRRPAK